MRGLVIAAAFALTTAARADFFNYRNVLPGERAAQLGGAYTALSDDVSGAFYNPAGLGFVTEPAISLSGTVYEIEINERTEYFGPAGAGVAQSVPLNRYNQIPSTAGFTYGLTKNLTFALSAIQADFIQLSAIGSANNLPIVVRFPSGASESYSTAVLRVRIDNQTSLFGGSLGLRLNDHWSIGGTIFFHLFQGSLGIVDDFTNGQNDQASSQVENTVWSAGVIPTAGVQYRQGRLQLGLSYWMETIHLAGQNTWTVSLASTSGFSLLQTGRSEGDARYPHRIAIGAAWLEPGRFLVTADVICYLPLVYSNPHEMLRTAVDDAVHDEVLHFDASLGAEKWLDAHWSLRFGVYTNSSGASDIYAPERVNQYGVTFGFGYINGGLVNGAGLRFEYGRSPRQRDPDSGSDVTWERFHFGITYGGTHRFLGG